MVKVKNGISEKIGVTPIALTSLDVKTIKPSKYVICYKVEGSDFRSQSLGHMDEKLAVLTAGVKTRMLERQGLPFELWLDELKPVLQVIGDLRMK